MLILIPLMVTGWMIGAFVRFLCGFQEWLPSSWREAMSESPQILTLLIEVGFSIAIAVVLAMGISFLGWISQQYLGKKLLEWVSELIQRIPVLRSVYSALDQMLKALGSGGGQQFSRVVYLEYPRQGLWTLGFVTGSVRNKALPDGMLNVFVPTTPNPTGGFYLLVPESQVRDSGMGVEDAFRTILSLGVAQEKAPEKLHG
jgi:uncharacterized membrane protein